MKVSVLLLAAAVTLLSACSSVATHKNPKLDLSRYHRIYVESRLGDDHGLDRLIVGELKGLGYEVSSGPLTMKPDNLDALIFYEDRWEWDFKSYMIEFRLTMRDARRDQTLATGSAFHSSFINKTPAEMIHEVIAPIFRRN